MRCLRVSWFSGAFALPWDAYRHVGPRRLLNVHAAQRRERLADVLSASRQRRLQVCRCQHVRCRSVHPQQRQVDKHLQARISSTACGERQLFGAQSRKPYDSSGSEAAGRAAGKRTFNSRSNRLASDACRTGLGLAAGGGLSAKQQGAHQQAKASCAKRHRDSQHRVPGTLLGSKLGFEPTFHAALLSAA